MYTILISFAVGIIVGFLVNFIFHFAKKPQGIFHVNMSDPDKDVYWLELKIPFGEITNFKALQLKVMDDTESRE